MARKIAAEVALAGGRTFYVGGCVRDGLMGIESKDIDIEVHGIPVAALEGILDQLGDRMSMGASFGVMALRHYDIDIAMPRSEVATGRGHKDFEVFVDPYIGPERAARRRDFTVNALMRDVLTGELLDFFGGQADLAARRMRHVSDATFAEDPLRVFRAAQFAARFRFDVAEETIRLCAGMDVAALSSERVLGELEKALLKAETPSVFFDVLRRMKQMDVWFPEVRALIGVEQNPRFHPECDVWSHTMQVIDQAAALRDRAQNPLGLMLSAVCHDFGKAVATREVKGGLHAYGHEKQGLPLAQRFMARLTGEVALTRYVLNMVELHMKPNREAQDGARKKTFMKLFDDAVCPDDLLLLVRADYMGRQATPADGPELEAAYAPMAQRLERRLEDYRTLMARPYVMGRDLVAAGVKPGPRMGEALAFAHKLRLAGLSREMQLRNALGWLKTAERAEAGEGENR